MPKSNAKASVKAIIKIEKYPDGVTQEQIDNGEVEPIEVIESEDVIVQ